MPSKNYEVIFLFKAQADTAIAQMSSTTDALKLMQQEHARLQEALGKIDALRGFQDAVKRAQENLAALEASERSADAALMQANQTLKDAQSAVNQHKTRIQELGAEIKNENARFQESSAAMKANGATQKELNEAKLEHKRTIAALTQEQGREKIALEQSKQALDAAKTAQKEAASEKKNAYKQTEAAQKTLDAEKLKLNACIAALKEAGVDTSNLEKAQRELEQQLAKTEGGIRAQEQAMAGWSATMERVEGVYHVLRAASTMMSGMSTAAKPVWELVTGSVQQAASLEKAIDAVRAVSGASAEETELVTQKIRELGRTTVFTAEEAAGAAQTMALAGWDAGQIRATLPGTVNLAAAAAEDLTTMTSILVDGMNAFQMTDSVKFADVLAKAATSSNTTVGLLGDSLSYVQTTAGNLGYTIEDTATALAAMANNALKGGVAGAGLNTMLTRMSGANSNAQKQMDAMGLSMFEFGTNRAKPLLTFLGELREAFQAFGDDQQAAQIAAYKLAGMRGMRGLLAIVNQSDEAWEKLTAEIANYNGAANQISSTRLENYAGKVQLLSDAWEDLKVSIGDHVLPVATDGVEVLTGLVNQANELAQTNEPLVLWAVGTSGAILGMSQAVGTAMGAAQGLYFSLKMLQMAGITVSLGTILGPLGVAAGAAVVAGGAFALLAKHRREAEEAMVGSRLREELEEAETETALEFRQRQEEAIAQTMYGQERTQALADADQAYREREAETQGNIRRLVRERAAFIEELKKKGHYSTFIDPDTGEEKVTAFTPEEKRSLDDFNAAIDDQYRKLSDLSKGHRELRVQTKAYLAEMGDYQGITVEKYARIEEAVQGLGDAWAAVWDATYEAYSGVFGLFEKAERKDAKFSEMIAGLESQSKFWEDYTSNLETLQAVAAEADIDLTGLWEALASSGSEEAAGQLDAIVKSLGDLENPDTQGLEKMVGLYQDVEEARKKAADTFTDGQADLQAALEEFDEKIRAEIKDTSAQEEARQAMLETLSGYTDTLEAEGAEAVEALKRLGNQMRQALYPNGVPTLGATGRGSSLAITTWEKRTPKAFAAGTNYAPPGLALVGEEGPELLMMRGGERVIPARQSRALLAHKSAPIQSLGASDVSITVNVTAESGTGQRQGENIGAAVEKAVRRAMRDAEREGRRRALR